MKTRLLVSAIVVFLFLIQSATLHAQGQSPNDGATYQRLMEMEQRIGTLQYQVGDLQQRLSSQTDSGGGVLLFLFGVFCALWAQNTGRSAWLWFFVGFLFNVLAVIVLLMKNSNDRFQREMEERRRRGFGHA